jgi:hypothetical protein
MSGFSKITIPGDVLFDERLSDGERLLYGKIAALSYSDGYCGATNRILAGAKTNRTASRQINNLINAGYLECRIGEQRERLLFISKVNSKVKKGGAL